MVWSSLNFYFLCSDFMPRLENIDSFLNLYAGVFGAFPTMVVGGAQSNLGSYLNTHIFVQYFDIHHAAFSYKCISAGIGKSLKFSFWNVYDLSLGGGIYFRKRILDYSEKLQSDSLGYSFFLKNIFKKICLDICFFNLGEDKILSCGLFLNISPIINFSISSQLLSHSLISLSLTVVRRSLDTSVSFMKFLAGGWSFNFCFTLKKLPRFFSLYYNCIYDSISPIYGKHLIGLIWEGVK